MVIFSPSPLYISLSSCRGDGGSISIVRARFEVIKIQKEFGNRKCNYSSLDKYIYIFFSYFDSIDRYLDSRKARILLIFQRGRSGRVFTRSVED